MSQSHEYFLREYVKAPALRAVTPANVQWALDEIEQKRKIAMTAWRIPEQGFAQGEVTFCVDKAREAHATFEILVAIGNKGRVFEFDHSGRCVGMRKIQQTVLAAPQSA